MTEELLDVYDGDGINTHKFKVRGQKLNRDEFFLVVEIWLVDDDGKILVQKRSISKASYPSMWAATGGAVRHNETSREGIIRETKEELGIDLKKVNYIGRIKRLDIFVDVYYSNVNGFDDSSFEANEEVDAVKWMTLEEINELINHGEFVKSSIITLNFFQNYLKIPYYMEIE